MLVHFSLLTPCATCPFRRKHGCILSKSRALELGTMMLRADSHTFTCHSTLHGTCSQQKREHCAGALIFAELQGKTTQAMRWAERLGMYDRELLMAPERQHIHAQVFATLQEFVAAQPGEAVKAVKKTV